MTCIWSLAVPHTEQKPLFRRCTRVSISLCCVIRTQWSFTLNNIVLKKQERKIRKASLEFLFGRSSIFSAERLVGFVCFFRAALISLIVKPAFDSQITGISPQQEITNGFWLIGIPGQLTFDSTEGLHEGSILEVLNGSRTSGGTWRKLLYTVLVRHHWIDFPTFLLVLCSKTLYQKWDKKWSSFRNLVFLSTVWAI